jgi:hypothetical protein
MSIEPEIQRVEITKEIRKAAKANPDGWVYKIDARYDQGKGEKIPFEGIVGWWKVDRSGEIHGEFILNPEYKSLDSEAKE